MEGILNMGPCFSMSNLGAHALRFKVKIKGELYNQLSFEILLMPITKWGYLQNMVVSSSKGGSKPETVTKTVNGHSSYVQFVHTCHKSLKMGTITQMYFVGQ